jgi:DNA replication protein DnaC
LRSATPCPKPSGPDGAQTAAASPPEPAKTLALSVQDHIALGLGLAACQKGRKVGFTTAAALVHELIEATDDRRLQRLQKGLATHDLLIIDELGFVPLSKAGAELLFEVISQRYERGSIIITSNLPFDEWTEVFGSERLTGAILDRLTHHVQILEMNGESFRLSQSRKAKS